MEAKKIDWKPTRIINIHQKYTSLIIIILHIQGLLEFSNTLSTIVFLILFDIPYVESLENGIIMPDIVYF